MRFPSLFLNGRNTSELGVRLACSEVFVEMVPVLFYEPDAQAARCIWVLVSDGPQASWCGWVCLKSRGCILTPPHSVPLSLTWMDVHKAACSEQPRIAKTVGKDSSAGTCPA